MELEGFYKVLPYDGVWLDMNEPTSFCFGSLCWIDLTVPVPCKVIDLCYMKCDTRPEVLLRWNNLLYEVFIYHNLNKSFYIRTIGMTTLHHDGSKMYDTHNIFGMAEGYVTAMAL